MNLEVRKRMRKKLKKLLVFVLALCMLAGTMTVTAFAEEVAAGEQIVYEEAAQEAAPAEETAPVDEAAPTEEAEPVEEALPAEEAVPADEAAPAEEAEEVLAEAETEAVLEEIADEAEEAGVQVLETTAVTKPAAKNGWVKTAAGNWYYFKSGEKLTGLQEIGDDTYYFGSTGRMVTGWKSISGKRYYFDPETGKMAHGMTKVGTRWYYFSEDNGAMQTGWKTIDGKFYFFKEVNPNKGVRLTGLRTIKGHVYYLDKKDNGAAVTGFKKMGGKWYFFGTATGRRVTGWKKVDGKWYYFDPETAVMQTRWQKIDGKYYFFNGGNDGSMVTGWKKIGGYWYYFKKGNRGYMVTGWQKVGNYWYYMEDSGKMVADKKLVMDNIEYVFKASGACQNPYDASTAKAMKAKAQNYSSPSNWLILIDCSKNRMGVFNWDGSKWTLHRLWMCTTGAGATPTVKGVFHIEGNRGYSFGSEKYTCYWYSGFYGPYLIHSVLYYPGTFEVKQGRLGADLSHGCVRLDIENAKWIYDYIPTGTTVVTY